MPSVRCAAWAATARSRLRAASALATASAVRMAAACSWQRRRPRRSELWDPHTGTEHSAQRPIANVPHLQLSTDAADIPVLASWYSTLQVRVRTTGWKDLIG